jgi:hypothetical protein
MQYPQGSQSLAQRLDPAKNKNSGEPAFRSRFVTALN